MPGMSPEGKDKPTSTMRMRPSTSTHAMLRPTSPTPPRKTTRQGFGSEETGVLQSLANALAFFGRGRHQRQPRGTGRAPLHLQRGLHRDGVGGDEQGVVERRERLVDLAGSRHVTG